MTTRPMPRTLLPLLLAALLFGAASARASEARTLRITNNSSYTMSVAFIWYDANNSRWIVQGWYNLNPGGWQNCVGYSDKIYYYAYAWNSNVVWGGNCNDNRTSRQTVVDDKMYFESGRVPYGRNQRQVCFNWIHFGTTTFMDWHLNN